MASLNSYLLFIFALVLVPLFFIVPAFISPLRRVPAAHPLAQFSSAWILWKRFRVVENATIKAVHDRLGPVVLLGPNEVSVNCVKGGLSTVYGGGMEKPTGKDGWYGNFTNFNVMNMFATSSGKLHSQRKRMISNIYSKSNIQSSRELAARSSIIFHKRILPMLDGICSGSMSGGYRHTHGVCDMYLVLCGMTMDIVTSYIFGLSVSANFTENPIVCGHFMHNYNSRHGYSFWPFETPGFLRLMDRFGLRKYFVPDLVAKANGEIEEWTMIMVDGARKLLDSGVQQDPENTPIVYQQLRLGLEREAAKTGSNRSSHEQRLMIASELLDHFAAGFDTSAITLTYLVWELSRPHNQHLQGRLRKELLTLSPILSASKPGSMDIPDAKSVDSLPLLQAIIQEVLRLHSAIPGPQPRETPVGGAFIGPDVQTGSTSPQSGRTYFIPGRVRVSANALTLHSNPDVFPDPSKFSPERWLTTEGEARKEMDRWFWAFGSGGRMCVGSNLAIYQMKFIIAAIYTSYRTHIIDDTGIEQEDAYTARPRGQKLMIKLEPVSNI
ncbi:cytochrome P450 [Pseudovirgaria hyperparasitica]|uniref:Cytochrome P450 n=1 Tax=Pseudovirgaria hyperparasitica TaxID=470096 RepID=A0A6A6VWF3_9PEZI|nr:cytochrome P450 [Pseudovirgaria hyperparasitica]KAF2753970.1 cytochrome P450 [Pseudovirgaria hyperparasitica]